MLGSPSNAETRRRPVANQRRSRAVAGAIARRVSARSMRAAARNNGPRVALHSAVCFVAGDATRRRGIAAFRGRSLPVRIPSAPIACVRTTPSAVRSSGIPRAPWRDSNPVQRPVDAMKEMAIAALETQRRVAVNPDARRVSVGSTPSAARRAGTFCAPQTLPLMGRVGRIAIAPGTRPSTVARGSLPRVVRRFQTARHASVARIPFVAT